MKGTQMNTATENLILRQRQRMYELRDDARDIASNVAEQVFDQFEREVDRLAAAGRLRCAVRCLCRHIFQKITAHRAPCGTHRRYRRRGWLGGERGDESLQGMWVVIGDASRFPMRLTAHAEGSEILRPQSGGMHYCQNLYLF